MSTKRYQSRSNRGNWEIVRWETNAPYETPRKRANTTRVWILVFLGTFAGDCGYTSFSFGIHYPLWRCDNSIVMQIGRRDHPISTRMRERASTSREAIDDQRGAWHTGRPAKLQKNLTEEIAYAEWKCKTTKFQFHEWFEFQVFKIKSGDELLCSSFLN